MLLKGLHVTDELFKKLTKWHWSDFGNWTGVSWQFGSADGFPFAGAPQFLAALPNYAAYAGAAPVGALSASQPNGTSLSPTADGMAMVQFMTGLNSSGIATTAANFWNWNSGSDPASYSGTIGSLGWSKDATVTYWFDPTSTWTSAEQASFTDALNLWSAEANIHFSLSTATTEPSTGIIIQRGANGKAETQPTNLVYNYQIGRGQFSKVTVSIDTTVDSWNYLGSFSASGGYGVETVTHELGHALGLGHPGPYNGNVQADQVLYTSDTRQYTIMSYVDPGSSMAKASSPADYSNASGPHYLTTPGQYDILAVQRFYGTPSNTLLTTGQTFGFNASAGIVANLHQFDFTVNTNPVVTIYDSGSGNVLDLSGFSAASTIDLNPGQFSSADGMVDNIGIAFDTWINTAIGGSGNDTFYVNGQSDVIDGGSGSDTVVFSGDLAGYTLGRTGSTLTVTSGAVMDSLSNIQTLQFADQTINSSSVPCFVPGTRILTPCGPVAVETLTEGAVVCTAAGGERMVTWIGHRTLNLAAHPHPPSAAPVRIQRDAFGPGRPCRDLVVSPDHAVFADGVLIPASLLVNGCTIVQVLDVARVTYLHLELDRHDVILAEQLPVESYLDTGNRAMFANAGLALMLHPDFSVRVGLKSWERDACAPLVTEGPILVTVRRRLLDRAIAQGYRPAADPRLRLVAGGRVLSPVAGNGCRQTFSLPAGTRRFHIHSRSAVPSEVGTHSGDHRQLGVAVTRMRLTNAGDLQELPVDHPTLRHGWHAVEQDSNRIWRWTNGAALVPLPAPVETGTLVELWVHGQLPVLVHDSGERGAGGRRGLIVTAGTCMAHCHRMRDSQQR